MHKIIHLQIIFLSSFLFLSKSSKNFLKTLRQWKSKKEKSKKLSSPITGFVKKISMLVEDLGKELVSRK